MYEQRSPYQTTVIEQPLVVVPLVSGPSAIITRHAPAHIRNGTKVCGHLFGVRCICCMSVFGVMMFVMGTLTLMLTNWNMDCYQSLEKTLPPTAIYGIIQVFLGAPFLFLSAYLCGTSRRNYNKQRSQESTAPYSQPFLEGRNPSENIPSRQRQSPARQTIADTAPSVYEYEAVPNPPSAPPAYNPVLMSGPHLTQQPQHNNDGVAMNQVPEVISIASSSVSNSAEVGTEQQTSQPLIDNFAEIIPDSSAPFTELEMALAQVHEQHPANAPPEYFP